MDNASNRIPYSILDLVPVSKGISPVQTFEKSLELARHAESLGYERIWYAEHHNMLSIASSATPVIIGYIASGTGRIRVGSGGIMLPNHSPLIIAEQFGTLATLYPGRIDLGLGRAPGTDPETAHAIRPDRMTYVHHFPDEIKKIEQYLSKDNAGAKVRVPFAEGVEIPIYVLGSSTDSAWLAARTGRPYAFASHFATGQLMEALNIYYNEFVPSAFLREPYAIACINVIAADTDEQAEKISTSLLRMFLNVLSGKPDYLQEPVEMTNEMRELWDHPSVQQMLKYTFTGSKETVKQKTEAFLALTRVNELMVVTNTFDHQDRLKSYKIFSEIMSEISMPATAATQSN